MTLTNGEPPVARVQVQMAVVSDVASYAVAGRMMDEIAKALDPILKAYRGTFDFVSFNTHPCKAAVMSAAYYGDDQAPVDPGPATHYIDHS